MKTSLLKWLMLGSLLISGLVAKAEHEIKILRQTPSELDRMISSHLCYSYELLHPYHRCQEHYAEQGELSTKELADFDFIITSEQYFNGSLARQFQLLIPLYQQAFIAVTRESSQDKLFSNQLNYGVLNQPLQKIVLKDVLKALNLSPKKLAITPLEQNALIDQFCSFDINVAFITSIQPSQIVRQLNTLCDGIPISIANNLPKNFFQRHRYLYQTTIPKSYYWRIPDDIETLSVRYLLAINQNSIDESELTEILRNFIQELDYTRGLAISERSIIENAENLQSTLHPLGEALLLQLTEKYQKLTDTTTSTPVDSNTLSNTLSETP
ncbi:hypothetical protein DC083_05425 [Ignatzschineria ureiclastica]|uniref:Uncharacterized protein n=1 Tax=Ignatzschineria ureiclastica TaxID=472582 RepID=A0A2U2AFH6_9GAMM|nr:TAXI family TRAP transporter solute-binding subunit [Ignatzschineria ureiclastica]PWD81329.1 hypothetical protein DC083_05425 [Ignatzschineria ureiclastica]GGZ98082.1 hypothetical protein GCM10007162_12920 [Ignatzschineria ureiclastica]